MREYETTFIVQPEISDEGIQSLCQRLNGVLERRGATRLLYDDLGKRRLAYEIQKFQKGHYLTLLYLDGGAAVPEIERTLRLEDSVLRFLTIQVEDVVEDIEARKAEAAELERMRAEKAAARAAEEAVRAAQAEEAAAAKSDEEVDEDAGEEEAEAMDRDAEAPEDEESPEEED